MDKENIVSYLEEIGIDMNQGKFIKAYKILEFLLIELKMDLKRESTALTENNKKEENGDSD